MNATQLLEHFDRLAEVPGAVPRLRRFILDLAVRGKLVEQDAGDEPAAELLERLASHMKKPTKNHGAAAKPAPSKHPFGWAFAKFSDVLTLEYGDNLPAEKRSNSGEFPVYGSNGVVGSHNEAFVHEPCIVVGRKGSAGALNLCTSNGSCVTDVAYYCVPPIGLDLQYTFKMLHTIGLDILSKGIKPGLSRAEAYELWVPIPPLAEQHRIVAKVDELMALCDQLEAAQQEREHRRDRLAAASLQRLNQPAADTTPEAQREHARFHLHHLPRLTTRPEHIRALRQTFLNLAVRGKLVAQDSCDEPATQLFKRIQVRKADLIKGGKLKMQVEDKGLSRAERPYPIPPNWMWATFGSIMISRDSDRIPVSKEDRNARAKTYDYYGASGVIDKIDSYLFDKPLLLIGEDGANLINRSTPIAFIAHGKYWVNNHAHVLDGITEEFLHYIGLYINAVDLKPYVTGTAQPKMNQAKMNSIPIALPPETEQHRIVAKVDELMALCDQLEAQLTTTQTDSRRLLEAVLEAALAPVIKIHTKTDDGESMTFAVVL